MPPTPPGLFGGLGMRGTGVGGGGSGEGTIGLGGIGRIGTGGGGRIGPTAPASRVRTGAVQVRGGLTRELVLRVIHAQNSHVRFCYEQALTQQPELAGTVTVRFVVEAGAVTRAAIGESTLANASVETCIVRAVQRARFPPAGDVAPTEVTYPFVLSTER